MLMNADAPIQFFITPDKVMIVNAYRDVTDVRMAKSPSVPRRPVADGMGQLGRPLGR